MPSLRSLIDPAGRSLTHHVNRLQAKLDELRTRLHEAAARMLGETVATVVEQVVRELLTTPVAGASPGYPPRDQRGYRDYARSDLPAWADPDSPEYLYDPHEPRPRYRRDDPDEDDLPEPPPAVAETPGVARWRQALAVGLRAAAWWLQRWTGRSALGVAVALGVTATAVVLAGGPRTVAGAGLVASALGLSGLVTIVHSGMAAFGSSGVT